jgi:hypothetical protein
MRPTRADGSSPIDQDSSVGAHGDRTLHRFVSELSHEERRQLGEELASRGRRHPALSDQQIHQSNAFSPSTHPFPDRPTAGAGVDAVPYSSRRFRQALESSKLQFGPAPYTEVTMPALSTFENPRFHLSGRDMVFSVDKTDPKNGDRTELRQQLVPGDDNANWHVSDTDNTMDARLRIADADMNECTVLQIHDKGGDDKPLLRLAYMNSEDGKTGELWAVLRGADGTYSKYAFGEVDDHAFDASVSVRNGTLSINANGVSKSFDVSFATASPMYFKAGCYPQGVGHAEVDFSALSFAHAP